MKLEKWDPELRTLLLRFKEGRLDLQPAFQRGLVWPPEKKARLIDSALRSWSIPPIHLIREPDGSLSVLDGQQRLAAFFDFVDNQFPVREFQPVDDNLSALVGLRFDELPQSIQYRVLDTRISAFEIYEFTPEEPYELFFRLNHPTGLTAAEKRNSLAGDTRAQIRAMVELATSLGWSKELIGFTDARGAYDDVLSRVCRYVESRHLDLRLSTVVMEDYYRKPGGVSQSTIETVRACIHDITKAALASPEDFKFNKATLVTWLLVAARGRLTGVDFESSLPHSIAFLERARLGQEVQLPRQGFERLIEIYRNRSSLRVADVLSVKARYAIAGFVVDSLRNSTSSHPGTEEIALFVVEHRANDPEDFESAFLELVSSAKEWCVFP